MSKKTFC